ncbi:P-II family nitrogen regulator [Thiomicrorhabdus sp. 6S2-11]|jgi:nitrogen regulatory protein PII|uniref:P-II family nitrogen regulator n=1 Tax=Thiomicrorhabdus marina TaxID=2818442 RepID=A0ABS3Q720_9GAMM|nr:P-II family nitrogen regulator [Thiomicrorhabdus marina]MBO1927610.1 P-II family nitrogen regulator [Thiomicrorhabdus marina]
MKLIKAVINPYKLDDVREALIDIGVNGVTITEVKGYGRQKGHTEIYRGTEYEIHFVPKLMLETVVPQDKLEDAMSIIVAHAKTGKPGDGKIFTFPVEKTVRIRTGESDQDAL